MTYSDVRPSVSSAGGSAAANASSQGNANKTTESNSQTDLDSLRRQVTDLQNAMAKLISDAGNMAVKSAKGATSDVASQVGTAASNIADKGAEMAQAASEQAKTFASELEKTARANPLGALAGALLVGVVIGLIGRSRICIAVCLAATPLRHATDDLHGGRSPGLDCAGVHGNRSGRGKKATGTYQSVGTRE